VASPEYLRRVPAPLHPDDLVRHNCVRLRFAATGAIYKWEFRVGGRMVEYEVAGNLTISDTLFSVEAALEGVGLAYTFEQLALPHVHAGRLERVLDSFSPTFDGFHLYYPSRHDQPSKLKALIEYINRRPP
jgi:DNA-binding transcriptional LysR family regulator